MADGEVAALQFEPLHKAHAIDQVAFGINFDRPIDDDALKAARTAVGDPIDLPGRAEIRGFAFGIGPTGPIAPGQIAAPVAGYVFTRARPDGAIETEFQLQRNSIALRTSLYSRWEDVWKQAKAYFDTVLPIYCSKVRMSQIALNYVDKFVCDAEVQKVRVADILQANSPYIAPRVLLSRDLWHCHTGTFVKIDAFTKRLTSVNVDFISEVMGEKNRAALMITSAVVSMFNQPGFDAFEPAGPDVSATVDRHFRELHDLDKQVIGGIISADMAKRIALGP